MAAEGDNCDIDSRKPDVNGCEEDVYFMSYSDLDIHELMLKDKPRTLAYKNFIEENKKLFKDKVVVDVGAGTGILSLFAAAAGAKSVYAVEASDIAAACNLVVQQNCFENVIKVIHKKVEDVVLPPGVKADILISEWMGFYLFHESMLDSIIHARDSLLKADGFILPSKATLFFGTNISELGEGKRLILSTSPFAEETHWKQTVFNLPAPLLIDKGDVIKCRMELAQDTKNKRRYNISIELLEVPELPEMSGGDTNGAEDVELDIGDDSDDSEDHPTPCNCDAPRCKIIKALVAKYDEQDEMMKQEGVVDITREELDEAVDISDNLDI
ncbi:protein arginine N-methyltransferase 1-like [Liolophura sinensis]|uniref:protein arginine N-methyltransferase 1-like n=1 Tax=Liolophura sinensis TaxID=3198878 RepID=UPI00315883F4